MVGRLIGTVIGGFFLAVIASSIGAVIAKQRMVSVGGPTDDEVALVGILEPVVLESTATAFRGGSVLAWMGGVDLDLRRATLAPEGATVAARAIFGGGRVIVPADWDVDIRMIGILGGVGDARPRQDRPAGAPRLVLEGFALLGGFGIVSEKAEEGRIADPVPEAAPVKELVATAKNGRA